MSAPDGGPAFPANELNADGSLYAQHFGMTLRDYFAAKAMQSLIRNNTFQYHNGTAANAYAVADAMLAERAK